MASRRRTWFLVRLAIYIAVIATLALVRGGVGWRRIAGALSTDHGHPALVIAGRDLAPVAQGGVVERKQRLSGLDLAAFAELARRDHTSGTRPHLRHARIVTVQIDPAFQLAAGNPAAAAHRNHGCIVARRLGRCAGWRRPRWNGRAARH